MSCLEQWACVEQCRKRLDIGSCGTVNERPLLTICASKACQVLFNKAAASAPNERILPIRLKHTPAAKSAFDEVISKKD